MVILLILQGFYSSNWAVAVQNIENKTGDSGSLQWRHDSMSDAEEGEALVEVSK